MIAYRHSPAANDGFSTVRPQARTAGQHPSDLRRAAADQPSREPADHPRMSQSNNDISATAHLMVCVGARKFSAEPDNRRAAALFMARNAVALALAEAPEADVLEAVLQTLRDSKSSAA